MYYFLNAYIPRYCSGIEHAEFKRLANFLRHGVPAKIVTATYSRTAAENLAANHLEAAHHVNLYDYFCDNVEVPMRQLTPAEIAGVVPLEQRGDAWHGRLDGWEQLCVHTVESRVDAVEYFDGDHQLVRRDYYDRRGFKGFSQFFATTDDEKTRFIALESFYSHTGRVGVEITYRRRGDGVVATSYRLIDKTGRQWQLMNPTQMYTVFLDQLNQGGDTFISDRSDVCNEAMLNMTTPARKIEHFHNIHFADYHDPMHSALTYPSIADTEKLTRTDLIITPTKAQADDMRTRLRTTVPIASIPVGSVPQAQLDAAKKPLAERTRGRLIVVARLFYEKHLDDALWAFKQAHDQLDWLTLDIYGYGDGATDFRDEKLLKQIIHEQHLEDCVHLHGYVDDIAAVYDDAQAMLLSSRFEGFVLAILEAAAHGVPTVSYDTHYGPGELIESGRSGELVPYGAVDGLAKKLVAVFSDDDYRQQLSAGAYARAQDFSEEAVWRQWEDKVLNRRL